MMDISQRRTRSSGARRRGNGYDKSSIDTGSLLRELRAAPQVRHSLWVFKGSHESLGRQFVRIAPMPFTLLLALLVFVSPAWADERRCSDNQPKSEYVGPLFDAMAQIESRMSGTVTTALDESGIPRMALFARLHRKRNGESDVLSLKRRFEQRFVMGTPKPFDQEDDLSDRFVDQTLSYLQDKRFQFVGEIMFAHADKTHGTQTSDGE